MTIASLREQVEKGGGELPLQPLDELAQLVVTGIRDGRFIMIMPSTKTEATLRERLDKIVRNENPTYSHSIG
jgi:hypothetical protein